MNDRFKSNLEYRKRINNALAYVREHLDKTISPEEVARAACFSPFHFHRIFTALMRETPGEYIARKKLERAAIKLAYSSDVNVTQMSFDYGYSSVSSFSKAFNHWFGCRPTEILSIKQRGLYYGAALCQRAHYYHLQALIQLSVWPVGRIIRYRKGRKI